MSLELVLMHGHGDADAEGEEEGADIPNALDPLHTLGRKVGHLQACGKNMSSAVTPTRSGKVEQIPGSHYFPLPENIIPSKFS